jgi:hypothetical protein
MRRCELYAEKQRMALRQKLPAIRHTQLTARATKTAAARLCVKPWCKAFAFASVPRPMRKSTSARFASNTSKTSCGRYWPQAVARRPFKRAVRSRKVQNPAKLCATGEATGRVSQDLGAAEAARSACACAISGGAQNFFCRYTLSLSISSASRKLARTVVCAFAPCFAASARSFRSVMIPLYVI